MDLTQFSNFVKKSLKLLLLVPKSFPSKRGRFNFILNGSTENEELAVGLKGGDLAFSGVTGLP